MRSSAASVSCVLALAVRALVVIPVVPIALAQSQDVATAVAPARESALVPVIQSDFALAIDGTFVLGTGRLETGVRIEQGAFPAWSGSFSSHEVTGYEDSGNLHLRNRAGETFTVHAQRGDERWQMEVAIEPRASGALEIDTRFAHNDAFVREIHTSAREGERVSVFSGVGDKGDASGGVRLDLIAKRAGTWQKPAVEPASATRTQNAPPKIGTQTRRMRPPRYPLEAMRAGIQGDVLVNVVIDGRGVPVVADVVGIEPSSAQELGGAAVAAALQWRYEAGAQGGSAVGGALNVPVNFRLAPGKGEKPLIVDQARDLGVSYRRVSMPAYPAHAIANRTEGIAFAAVEVGADGRVVTARVEAFDPENASELGEAALEAIKTWQFSPQTRAGKAVAANVRVPVRFKLSQDASITPLPPDSALPPAHCLQTIEVVAPAVEN
jgi:TonB family protein